MASFIKCKPTRAQSMVYYGILCHMQLTQVAILIDISQETKGYIIGPIIVFSLHIFTGFIYFHYIFVYISFIDYLNFTFHSGECDCQELKIN